MRIEAEGALEILVGQLLTISLIKHLHSHGWMNYDDGQDAGKCMQKHSK